MTQPSESLPANTLELTLRVVVIGVVLSVVMGAANVYLGLKAGMTVSASIPAAVIGMLVLRTLFKGGTILEANQIQTAASAGESLAAGIIFTMPALVLIGVWEEFDWVLTAVIAFTGGLLGILFMIPMRRVFVTGDNPELTYPEGVACAAVLKAGDSAEAGASGADAIVKGTLIGAGFKALIGFLGVIRGTLEGAVVAGKSILFMGSDVSPALVGVGFIVRLNVAVLIFIGGALGWLIGIPLLGEGQSYLDHPVEGAMTLWSTKIRYVGVGAMVVGGIATIVKVRHSLVDAVRVIRKGGGDVSEDIRDKNIPTRMILILSLIAALMVGGIYYHLTGSIAITIPTTVIMIVMSLFFTAVASYIVGLVGNSNSPVSGMTITAVLFTGGLLYVMGFSGTQGMLATLGVAAIVCCAACTSGDVCNDLKTGQLVGASPYRQQIMQIVGIAAACLVMAPVLQLLHDQTPGGIGGPELSAPQATLFKSLAEGFFGDEILPMNMIYIGAALGVALVLLDRWLENRKSSFRAYVMPIAVGMYLPLALSTPILIGGLISHFVAKGAKSEKELDSKTRRGLLLASGIIAGEALMGVGLALLSAGGISSLALGMTDAGEAGWVGPATWVAAIGLLVYFFRESKSRS